MNPNDAFPRRNLPGDAEDWGRKVEDRIRNLEYGYVGQKTNLQSENRSSSSSLQELARQIVQLNANQAALDAAIRAVPRTIQSTAQNAGFGLGSGWNTVVYTEITVPSGMTNCKLLVIGSGQVVTATTTQNVQTSYKVNVPNVGESPTAPGPWTTGYGDFRTVMTPSYSWSFGVTPGQTIRGEFQVAPNDSNAYPGNGNSYAVISLLATFSG